MDSLDHLPVADMPGMLKAHHRYSAKGLERASKKLEEIGASTEKTNDTLAGIASAFGLGSIAGASTNNGNEDTTMTTVRDSSGRATAGLATGVTALGLIGLSALSSSANGGGGLLGFLGGNNNPPPRARRDFDYTDVEFRFSPMAVYERQKADEGAAAKTELSVLKSYILPMQDRVCALEAREAVNATTDIWSRRLTEAETDAKICAATKNMVRGSVYLSPNHLADPYSCDTRELVSRPHHHCGPCGFGPGFGQFNDPFGWEGYPYPYYGRFNPFFDGYGRHDHDRNGRRDHRDHRDRGNDRGERNDN